MRHPAYHDLLLQGVPRDVAETCLSLGKEMESMMAGDVDGFDDKMRPLLRIMCAEVARQKRRLGGDFAVAHAVVSRHDPFEMI